MSFSACFMVDITLLAEILRNAKGREAEMASHTISKSEQIREQRNIIGKIPPAVSGVHLIRFSPS